MKIVALFFASASAALLALSVYAIVERGPDFVLAALALVGLVTMTAHLRSVARARR